MSNSVKLIIAATIFAFACGILVTYIDFNKTVEVIIFPVLPVLGGLAAYFLSRRRKNTIS